VKDALKQAPVVGDKLRRLYWKWLGRGRQPLSFPGSTLYWETRYAGGGNSGVGSEALFAEFKAEVLNAFVARHHVQTVIDFGCGDGRQLNLARYPAYLGLDVSRSAILRCRESFASDTRKSFHLLSDYNGETADLAISLDVIYHLVEENIFEDYMRMLFMASTRYVIIYSSDSDEVTNPGNPHITHRKFTRWVRNNLPNWRLAEHVPNRYPYHGDYRKGSFADFYIYEKT
jgi:hypothetical protein